MVFSIFHPHYLLAFVAFYAGKLDFPQLVQGSVLKYPTAAFHLTSSLVGAHLQADGWLVLWVVHGNPGVIQVSPGAIGSHSLLTGQSVSAHLNTTQQVWLTKYWLQYLHFRCNEIFMYPFINIIFLLHYICTAYWLSQWSNGFRRHAQHPRSQWLT